MNRYILGRSRVELARIFHDLANGFQSVFTHGLHQAAIALAIVASAPTTAAPAPVRLCRPRAQIRPSQKGESMNKDKNETTTRKKRRGCEVVADGAI